ncbi:hypothetical protein HR059_07425 [Sinorhizobium meliloti WSM1022]|uniref:hypothetical protein n=1 Tax=Rhizobium meliloti TaxID=382 RepID=UPI000481D0F5|nr:hypothetical protein [Sinorhizobium meliloti]QKN14303.1 hypothetical protein HR059_07425 [Sinorhizobium meliloti WSM1022]
MKLFNVIHDALEEHLPKVADEADRQEALVYLRGLKTLLATVAEPEDTNLVQFEHRLTQRRIDKAIHEKRQRQLSAARDCVKAYGIKEFGDLVYADDDGFRKA